MEEEDKMMGERLNMWEKREEEQWRKSDDTGLGLRIISSK